MKAGSLKSSVNFYISVFFIGTFGLVATSTLLRAAQLDDPISNGIAASAGYKSDLIRELDESPPIAP